jgi:transposase
MWAFRTRPEKLTDEQHRDLEELFRHIPDLEGIYWFRWGITEVFDRAKDEQEAEEQLEEYRSWWQDDEDFEDLQEFFALVDRHRDGILAYFAEGKSSGVVEGLNNKARVVTKRCYGVKNTQTLWERLYLDVNMASAAVGWTVKQLHSLANRIRTHFLALYT